MQAEFAVIDTGLRKVGVSFSQPDVREAATRRLRSAVVPAPTLDPAAHPFEFAVVPADPTRLGGGIHSLVGSGARTLVRSRSLDEVLDVLDRYLETEREVSSQPTGCWIHLAAYRRSDGTVLLTAPSASSSWNATRRARRLGLEPLPSQFVRAHTDGSVDVDGATFEVSGFLLLDQLPQTQRQTAQQRWALAIANRARIATQFLPRDDAPGRADTLMHALEAWATNNVGYRLETSTDRLSDQLGRAWPPS